MLLFLCTILLGAQNCNKNAISSNGIFSMFQPQNVILPQPLQQLQQQLQQQFEPQELQQQQQLAASRRNVLINLCEKSSINTVHVEADPNDCEKFYMCFNNYGELFNCPPGHYFDAIEMNCMAGICNQQIFKVNALKKNLLNQTSSSIEAIPMGDSRKIRKTQEYDILNDADVCQTNTLMREPTDCHVFFICLQGRFWRMRCPTGRYFDSEKAKCVHIENNLAHQCSCVLPAMKLTANIKNRKQYYICQDGQAKLRECEAGYYFNKSANGCLMISSHKLLDPTKYQP